MAEPITHVTYKTLEPIVNNPATLSLVRQAQSLLFQSGLLAFLWERSRGRAVNKESMNFIAQQAHEYSRAEGYTEAIEDIAYFFEKFVTSENQIRETSEPDFGSIDALLRNGDIDQKEANELRDRKRRIN